ncbi:MAG: hypothetical protein IE931_03365 [Sphingobacteriales bacterium]|nr:hypothetical protein [Sphingobacteriales bacterium]
MKKLPIFLLLMALLAIASCKCKQPVITQQKVTDTVTKTIVIRDTVLIAPKAQTQIKIPVKALATGKGFNQTSKSGQANLNIKRENDNLVIDCLCDTLAIKAQLRNEFEQRNHKEVLYQPPVEVKYTPLFTKILAWIGGIFLTLIAGATIYWLIKRKLI